MKFAPEIGAFYCFGLLAFNSILLCSKLIRVNEGHCLADYDYDYYGDYRGGYGDSYYDEYYGGYDDYDYGYGGYGSRGRRGGGPPAQAPPVGDFHFLYFSFYKHAA